MDKSIILSGANNITPSQNGEPPSHNGNSDSSEKSPKQQTALTSGAIQSQIIQNDLLLHTPESSAETNVGQVTTNPINLAMPNVTYEYLFMESQTGAVPKKQTLIYEDPCTISLQHDKGSLIEVNGTDDQRDQMKQIAHLLGGIVEPQGPNGIGLQKNNLGQICERVYETVQEHNNSILLELASGRNSRSSSRSTILDRESTNSSQADPVHAGCLSTSFTHTGAANTCNIDLSKLYYGPTSAAASSAPQSSSIGQDELLSQLSYCGQTGATESSGFEDQSSSQAFTSKYSSYYGQTGVTEPVDSQLPTWAITKLFTPMNQSIISAPPKQTSTSSNKTCPSHPVYSVRMLVAVDGVAPKLACVNPITGAISRTNNRPDIPTMSSSMKPPNADQQVPDRFLDVPIPVFSGRMMLRGVPGELAEESLHLRPKYNRNPLGVRWMYPSKLPTSHSESNLPGTTPPPTLGQAEVFTPSGQPSNQAQTAATESSAPQLPSIGRAKRFAPSCPSSNQAQTAATASCGPQLPSIGRAKRFALSGQSSRYIQPGTANTGAIKHSSAFYYELYNSLVRLANSALPVGEDPYKTVTDNFSIEQGDPTTSGTLTWTCAQPSAADTCVTALPSIGQVETEILTTTCAQPSATVTCDAALPRQNWIQAELFAAWYQSMVYTQPDDADTSALELSSWVQAKLYTAWCESMRFAQSGAADTCDTLTVIPSIGRPEPLDVKVQPSCYAKSGAADTCQCHAVTKIPSIGRPKPLNGKVQPSCYAKSGAADTCQCHAVTKIPSIGRPKSLDRKVLPSCYAKPGAADTCQCHPVTKIPSIGRPKPLDGKVQPSCYAKSGAADTCHPVTKIPSIGRQKPLDGKVQPSCYAKSGAADTYHPVTKIPSIGRPKPLDGKVQPSCYAKSGAADTCHPVTKIPSIGRPKPLDRKVQPSCYAKSGAADTCQCHAVTKIPSIGRPKPLDGKVQPSCYAKSGAADTYHPVTKIPSIGRPKPLDRKVQPSCYAKSGAADTCQCHAVTKIPSIGRPKPLDGKVQPSCYAKPGAADTCQCHPVTKIPSIGRPKPLDGKVQPSCYAKSGAADTCHPVTKIPSIGRPKPLDVKVQPSCYPKSGAADTCQCHAVTKIPSIGRPKPLDRKVQPSCYAKPGAADICHPVTKIPSIGRPKPLDRKVQPSCYAKPGAADICHPVTKIPSIGRPEPLDDMVQPSCYAKSGAADTCHPVTKIPSIGRPEPLDDMVQPSCYAKPGATDTCQCHPVTKIPSIGRPKPLDDMVQPSCYAKSGAADTCHPVTKIPSIGRPEPLDDMVQPSCYAKPGATDTCHPVTKIPSIGRPEPLDGKVQPSCDAKPGATDTCHPVTKIPSFGRPEPLDGKVQPSCDAKPGATKTEVAVPWRQNHACCHRKFVRGPNGLVEVNPSTGAIPRTSHRTILPSHSSVMQPPNTLEPIACVDSTAMQLPNTSESIACVDLTAMQLPNTSEPIACVDLTAMQLPNTSESIVSVDSTAMQPPTTLEPYLTPIPEAIYSRRVFVGGIPHGATKEDFVRIFGTFGKFDVSWPNMETQTSPARGFAWIDFEAERSVIRLLESSMKKNGQFFYKMVTVRGNFKHVEVAPWELSKTHYTAIPGEKVDQRMAVFVGGVPRACSAKYLADALTDLFGCVVYCVIDTDRNFTFPKGCAHVFFQNRSSYVLSICAQFIHVKVGMSVKKMELQPLVSDELACDFCLGGNSSRRIAGALFCPSVECLKYHCHSCWVSVHCKPGKEAHRAVNKVHKLHN